MFVPVDGSDAEKVVLNCVVDDIPMKQASDAVGVGELNSTQNPVIPTLSEALKLK